MLKRLYIKDFAIVDQLEIEFGPGFHVLTGETGAGKSILVGALGLLCGERSQSDLVRAGANKAILEAEFQLNQIEKMESLINKLAIDIFDDVLIIRREINVKGVSRAFINDTPVNINALNNITGIMVDLHGQHQHQRLIHPENHIDYLDSFGKILPLLNKFRNQYQEYYEQKNMLLGLMERRKSSYEKHDLYTFQVEELEKAHLEPEELDTLISEKKILENNETLYEITNLASTQLYSAEESASNAVAKVIEKLHSIVDIDPSFDELIKNLETAQVSVEETGRQCEAYGANLEFNPARLEEIRNREAELAWLLKKYQVKSVSDLIHLQDKMKKDLDDIENFDEKISELEKSLEASRGELQVTAIDLSEKRQKLGKKFAAQLEPILTSVGLKNVRFDVHIQWQEKADGVIQIDGKSYDLTENGLDQIEFNVGLNIGEPTRPLHKVASGGEVSRIMLGIKALLAETDDIDTLVFDEIDSGISGRYAQIVGRKMAEIAEHHQMLVITHLPQIAAQAKYHYTVIKQEAGGRTKVDVKKLTSEERVLDIAKLLGGKTVTSKAIANAKELLEQSENHPSQLEIASNLKT